MRLVAGRANARGVAGEMAHFARAKFAVHFRCDVDLERARDLSRDFTNGHAATAADIHRQSIELVRLGREQVGARDVFDKRKVARLFAVFVKHRRQIVQQTRAENRDHAGVRIEDRLARSIRARVTQRDGGNAGLFSPKQHQFFLVDFRQAVNGFAADRRVFRRRRAGRELAANRAMHLPIAAA